MGGFLWVRIVVYALFIVFVPFVLLIIWIIIS
mgnify:CR=1 FL=1